MSDEYKSPFQQMNWAEMQKQFMESLMNFANQNQMGATSRPAFSSGTNWADAMDFWWQAFKPESVSKNEYLFNKMLEQCKTYYVLSEQFTKLYEAMGNARNSSEDFMQSLNEQFQNMEQLMAEGHQFFSWSNLVDQFEQPAELLKSFMSISPALSGDVLNELSPELKKLREKFLTIPGLGYSREAQEKLQEAMRLWANYQDNYQEFHNIMSRLNHDALELMRKRLLQMHKEGVEIESMRQIYNLWVDSNEKVYGEFVFTEEYADLNARLVNSLMAFKNKSHEITEDYLTAMNLPTSGSINALERRQHELRKQVRAIEGELKSIKMQLVDKQSELKEHEATTGSATKQGIKTTEKAAVANSVKKPKKRKRQAKKTTAKTSSQVVDFKKSQQKKEKKKQSVKQAADKDADGKRMIEIKF